MDTNFKLKKIAVFILVFFLLITSSSFTAQAKYKISYKSAIIEITRVEQDVLESEGMVSVAGKTNLPKVWFCVRGPAKQVVTYPVEVKDGKFSLEIWLRFGTGTYTFWAGDNPNSFDGEIRFELENSYEEDITYLAPSAYIDSTNPEIIKLIGFLLKPSMTEQEKIKSIYDWVIENISYDNQAYLKGRNVLNRASEVLKTKSGLCRDYAFLIAALARAARLQARVVYGSTEENGNWTPVQHAWNEVCVDGEWIVLDPTWGAGYLSKDGKFVNSPTDKYFVPDLADFSKTHLVTSVTYH